MTWDHWKEFMGISIHVPREGDDFRRVNHILIRQTISIHVPREGDDHYRESWGTAQNHFNPRPP